MNILHVGALPSPLALDGVNATIWQAAAAQGRAGHRVTLLVDRPPNKDESNAAAGMNVMLTPVASGHLAYNAAAIDRLARDCDVIHLHSVFILRQAMLARHLSRLGVPYVITPNGGLSPVGLRRGAMKKFVYSLLLERPRFRSAAAVSVVVPREADDIRAFVPDYAGIIRYIPNPVDVSSLTSTRWNYRPNNNRVAFLGRFDVLHKGLDLLWEIARRMPHLSFDLYGREDHRTRRWFARLMKVRPANVHLNPPVFGAAKFAALADAALYLQPARWEGFPLSVAEAMLIGVPCALPLRINAGKQLHENDIGPTFDAEPDLAAKQIDEVIGDREKLERWSARAREFALNRFDAGRIAQQFLDLYRDVLQSPDSASAPLLVETMS